MNMQKQAQEVLEMLKENSKRKGSSGLKASRVYTSMVPADITGVRLAPQAIALVGAMLNAPEDEWTEPEMHALVMEIEELSKKQGNWKIFQYYRKSLVENGFLAIVNG